MNSNKILGIVGAGDLGQQIAHYALTDGHYNKIVFIDDYVKKSDKKGISIIGRTSKIELLFKKNLFNELIIGVGYKHLDFRKEIYEQYCETIPFGKIIHSSSWVDSSAIVKKGSVIFPNCCIDIQSIISENNIINSGCTIAHNAIIEAHSFLAPRVAIAGYAKVGEQCFLGINSTIIDNISITGLTKIGAGTVIINNIDKKGLYVGNPERFLK